MPTTTLGTATTRPGEAIRPGYGVTSTNAATAVTNHTPAHSRISWGAVFAGAAVAVATTVLLSLLGAALGMGSINTMTANASDVRSFSQGAGLWQIVNYVFSMALGGYVAARMSGTHSHLDGELHGLTTWAIALLFGAWLFAQALGGAIGSEYLQQLVALRVAERGPQPQDFEACPTPCPTLAGNSVFFLF